MFLGIAPFLLFDGRKNAADQQPQEEAAVQRHMSAKKDTTFIVSRKQQYSRKVTWDGIPNKIGVSPILVRGIPAIQLLD